MVGTRKLLRGHYNPTNWSRKYPNLQKTLTPAGETVLACTQCIRTFSKDARMAANKEKRAKLAVQKAAEAKARAEKRKAVEAKKSRSARSGQVKAKKDKGEKKVNKKEDKKKQKTA